MPLSFLLAMLLAPPADGLAGLVVDQSGASVAGASITVEDTSGAAWKTSAGVTGAFRFTGLPPGAYTVRVEQPGFKAITRRWQSGESAAPLRFTLQLADLREQITVGNASSQVGLDSAENLDVIKIDRRTLRRLPTLGNDVVGAAAQFLDQGAVGAAGVSLVVDGVESKRVGVSASAIQEVRINQNPYSAEFERPGRGRIEIITEPAEPQYHGSTQFVFRDSVLDARNAFAAERPDEQRRIFEGHFTGPIGRSKKTRFLFTVNREDQALSSLVYAHTPTGIVQENSPHPVNQTEFSLNITRQLTDRQTLIVRYEPSRDSSDGNGVGGFVLPEAAFQSTAREEQIFLDHTAQFAPGLVSQFRVRMGYEKQENESRLQGVRKTVVQDAFTSGGAQADRLNTEGRLLFNEVLSWTRRRHFITGGISVPGFRRWGLSDHTNWNGTYSFSTLDDYSAARPFLFQAQRGNANLVYWERAFGIFIQDQFKLRPNLSLSFGLRYDWQNHVADHNNFAPRVSIALSPDRARKTVLRAGSGFFYERTGNGPIADLLRYDGKHLLPFVLTDPGYPNPISPSRPFDLPPVSRMQFAGNLRSPYLWQYSGSVERQWAKTLMSSLGYTGMTGVSMFRSRDANAPLAPLYQSRPDPSTGVVRTLESAGRLQGHALDATLRGSFGETFSGTFQYTLSKTMNNTDSVNFFPADSNYPAGEWARAGYDVRHRIRALGTWSVFEWFEFGAICSWSTSSPLNITTGRDDNLDGRANDRPFGVSRNSAQRYGALNLDLRITREFKLGKGKDQGPAIEPAIEAFNIFNHVNFTSVVGNLSSPFFGHPVASQPGRRIQLRVEFKF